jgi:hypothetical protein
MISRLVLGVDPGTTSGAAILLASDGSVPLWATWVAVAAGLRVTAWNGEVGVVGDCFEIGRRLGRAMVRDAPRIAALSIEGLGSRTWGAQPLIESVGSLRSGLSFGGTTWEREIRPLAVARKGPPGWRARVLGLPKMKAPAAEKRAIAWAMSRGLPRGLTRAEQGAWSEALAIAAFGAMECNIPLGALLQRGAETPTTGGPLLGIDASPGFGSGPGEPSQGRRT